MWIIALLCVLMGGAVRSDIRSDNIAPVMKVHLDERACTKDYSLTDTHNILHPCDRRYLPSESE
jgi:hypothetical protein